MEMEYSATASTELRDIVYSILGLFVIVIAGVCYIHAHWQQETDKRIERLEKINGVTASGDHWPDDS